MHGGEYDGFRIAEGGDYNGKVVGERSDGNGGMVQYRPLDLSITKNVAALIISALVVALMAFWLVRWYKRNGMKAPRRGLGAFEVTVAYIYDGVIKPTLGVKAKKFAPYLLTVFFFILTMNLLGLIVIFPRRCQPDGQPCRYIGIVDFHFLVDQLVWYQALLERHILARCALVAQGAYTHDARYRAIWYIHQAGGTHRPSVCQHDGWSHDSDSFDIVDIHIYRNRRSCNRWSDNGGIDGIFGIHVVDRHACELHPGLCVHDAFHIVHLLGSGQW